VIDTITGNGVKIVVQYVQEFTGTIHDHAVDISELKTLAGVRDAHGFLRVAGAVKVSEI